MVLRNEQDSPEVQEAKAIFETSIDEVISNQGFSREELAAKKKRLQVIVQFPIAKIWDEGLDEEIMYRLIEEMYPGAPLVPTTIREMRVTWSPRYGSLIGFDVNFFNLLELERRYGGETKGAFRGYYMPQTQKIHQSKFYIIPERDGIEYSIRTCDMETFLDAGHYQDVMSRSKHGDVEPNILIGLSKIITPVSIPDMIRENWESGEIPGSILGSIYQQPEVTLPDDWD